MVLAVAATACGGDAAPTAEFERQRDSLASLADEREMQIDRMSGYFDSVASCLDSIAVHEHLLLPVVDPETNRAYSRSEVRERLELLAELISRQRERIRQLTDSLANTGGAPGGSGISNTVLYLTQQLEEKESKLAQLMAELKDRNRNIRELTRQVGSLSEELRQATEQNAALAEAVTTQSDMMNEAYVLIGTKKQLQQAGALTKGNLFKKGTFNAAGIDKSKCRSVDIRQLGQVPLGARNPKLLSTAPACSYHWQDTGDGKTLVIDDVTAFWSLSNILVIQL